MKVLVCGGRDFNNYGHVWEVLNWLHETHSVTLVIQGGASGADSHAANWARNKAIPVATYKADWHSYGDAAGPKRNKQMLDEAQPDLVLAFPGGKGTANMVKQAKNRDFRVHEVLK